MLGVLVFLRYASAGGSPVVKLQTYLLSSVGRNPLQNIRLVEIHPAQVEESLRMVPGGGCGESLFQLYVKQLAILT